MKDENQLNITLENMRRDIDNLKSKVNDEQFSDRYKFFKQIIIARDTGKFLMEEKTAIPSTGVIGELAPYNGRYYQAVATDTWQPIGILPVRSISAGTASDSPSNADGLIQCNTSAGQALTVTQPEAANNLGKMIVYTFVADGGQNVTINRTGSDTFDDSGDTGNTSITMDSAGDSIAMIAIQDNIWFIINNISCTLT